MNIETITSIALSFLHLLLRLFAPVLLFGTILYVFLSGVLNNFALQAKALSLFVQAHGMFSIYGPPFDAAISDIDKVTLFYNTFRDIGRVYLQ